MSRWVEHYGIVPEAVRRRLVLENDERVYSVRDVLALHEACGVPVVLDGLHHRVHPEDRTFPLAKALTATFATWGPADGPPKTHFSSQAIGRRAGAHADYIDEAEFFAFLDTAPDMPFDCMIEAKAKDLAVLRLRAALAARGTPVG